MLAACDVYRPAAIDQLKVLGAQIGVEVYTEEGNQHPVEIAGKDLTDPQREAFYKALDSVVGNLRELTRNGIPE